jgi:hypothetical protein
MAWPTTTSIAASATGSASSPRPPPRRGAPIPAVDSSPHVTWHSIRRRSAYPRSAFGAGREVLPDIGTPPRPCDPAPRHDPRSDRSPRPAYSRRRDAPCTCNRPRRRRRSAGLPAPGRARVVHRLLRGPHRRAGARLARDRQRRLRLAARPHRLRQDPRRLPQRHQSPDVRARPRRGRALPRRVYLADQGARRRRRAQPAFAAHRHRRHRRAARRHIPSARRRRAQRRHPAA